MGMVSVKVLNIQEIHRRTGALALVVILACLLLGACSPATPEVTPETETQIYVPVITGPTRTPFQSQPNPPTPGAGTPEADVEAGGDLDLTLALAPYLPVSVRQGLQVPEVLTLVDSPEAASLQLAVGDGELFSRAVYALVAPFATIEDGVSGEGLRQAWQGDAQGPFAGRPLWMDEDTRQALTAYWGEPGEDAVATRPAGELVAAAWDEQPSWGIVPFAALEPRWKVLEIDGRSPIQADFELDDYPLALPLTLQGDEDLAASIFVLYGPESEAPLLPPADRDPSKFTSLVMTGVTALVRATAWTMELQGITYPARDIGDWLREADITHISNEVPFAASCPYPDPGQKELRFCSDPRYIELLEDVSTDVVELTGDHFQDWGTEAMYLTLDMYREREWPYYGGGQDFEDARKSIVLEHNGNRVGFIGCNGKGGGYAGASATTPGAVYCDFEFMEAEIARLREEGVLPVATFQHFEYYTYEALPNQIADFGRLAEAGAVIVSGSQAHHPQAFEFKGDSFIHYGLGNLFFDQLDIVPNGDIAFIDRHVIYDGRHLSTELYTIRFEDYARARPMTDEERASILANTFRASGW